MKGNSQHVLAVMRWTINTLTALVTRTKTSNDHNEPLYPGQISICGKLWPSTQSSAAPPPGHHRSEYRDPQIISDPETQCERKHPRATVLQWSKCNGYSTTQCSEWEQTANGRYPQTAHTAPGTYKKIKRKWGNKSPYWSPLPTYYPHKSQRWISELKNRTANKVTGTFIPL
jgi:hypothetical protein